MGTVGVEPTRLAAHDPKSCLSASSSMSPRHAIPRSDFDSAAIIPDSLLPLEARPATDRALFGLI